MKGIIYKMYFGKWLYIGSTTDIKNRQKTHNYDYKTLLKDSKLYQVARENNVENIECELIEEIEINDIEDLRKKEEEYRINLDANLNEIA